MVIPDDLLSLKEMVMKAIRVHEFGDPEVMRIEEVPDPEPGPGQVLVRARAVGVNPVDTYIRTGTYTRKPDLPYTPGLDAAGIVERVGDGVGHIKAGDRVYVAGSHSGTYAELILCRESEVHPLPERVSFAQGAGIGVPYGTAYYGLFFRAHALPGEFVLVHGASGGVGTAAVQVAKASGMQVIGTAGSEKGKKLVLDLGAYHVLDHGAPDYLKDVQSLTCGHGVDVVMEMLANVNLGKDLGILAQRGRVVVIGCRGTVELDPRAAMGKNASILGMVLFNATEAEEKVVHAALVAGLENGSLHPVVGEEVPLAEAARAHREVMAPGSYGKVVLVT
jgi:NADPH2:quinone reductase